MNNATFVRTAKRPAVSVDSRRKRVADEVRACIAREGVSRSDVERAARISQSALSRKLRGVTAFTVDELFDIGAFLGVEPQEFFAPGRAA